MRVFLDTNVIASATATRGLCADLFREVLLAHHLVISQPLLDELARVLADKFGADPALISEVVHLLQQDATMAEIGVLPAIELADADDLPIVAGAIAGRAEVLVTGDKAVQAVGHVGDLEILSPRQFWERLAAGKQLRARRGE